MENDQDKAPAHTLDSLAEWLGDIEDKAWLANSGLTGIKFAFFQLLVELDKRGVIDAPDFISVLQRNTPQYMDSAQDRQGIQSVVDELAQSVALSRRSAGRDSPGGASH